jgi:hypothetical protein
MPGHLSTHPFIKSYDELQRSVKRMENYLDTNSAILSDDMQLQIQVMIESMEKAIRCIPESYRVTRHFQIKHKDK